MRTVLWTLMAAGVVFLMSAFPAHAQESLEHLKLPRWAALASAEINMRTGPGKRYPIDWVIKKKELPVEVVQEFEHWRKVKLVSGEVGWVHKSMLSGMRRVLVKGHDTPLLAKPFEDAMPRAKIQKGVIAKLEQCQKKWCDISAQGFEGWVPKKTLWGVYPDEILE